MYSPSWSVYEDAARRVISDIRQHLGVAAIEGKQGVQGDSGTIWEIDAKAWRDGLNNFLIVEVRRHTTSRLNQEHVAAIAYRIHDVGGDGGIVVSPHPMQKGANIVADHEDIAHIILSKDSTPENYLAEFMGKRFLGASITESANATDSCDAKVIRGNQNRT
jgi:hypothetical protein